jgi:hypothetical protein
MKKASVIALTAVVWIAGVAAAAGLAYDVTRPPPVAQVDPIVLPSHAVLAELPREPLVRTIVLPTVEIRGLRAQPAAKPVAEHLASAPMHCSDWRPLEQGSASVQICD